MSAGPSALDGLLDRLTIGWVDDQERRHRILIPDITVLAAAVTGCPLAHACTLLDLESNGGRNVFGAPKKPCGQPRYSAVTETSYTAYKKHRSECGTQGVGPLQITFSPLQDRADDLGGCWRSEINLRLGLGEFASYLRRDTEQAAYSRWNTGKPGDSPYARRALALLPRWREVIDHAKGDTR